ncbi:MAG: MucB/RseB C-terminal domain-containing protein [Rhodocyclaceae bacterium]|nr:MucB/RseB C-terminal domain-containing protein [Rhodocyclaceae bacterium]
MASAAKQLNYAGTFTYLSGQRFETMRIARASGPEGEVERLETLDGSPREVVRRDGEVRCVLPDLKTVIIDRQGRRRAFPDRLPVAVSGLEEHYRIVKGDLGRVAGRQAQAVMLEPLDNLRYGHHLWADVETGLLLKARMVDPAGGVVEQFVFSEVTVGELAPELFAARYTPADDWHVVNARGNEASSDDIGWSLVDMLPGYRLVSSVRRSVGEPDHDVLHLVYSDGLTHISVFVEPETGNGAVAVPAGFLSAGSIGVYKRSVAGSRLMVLGEAPREALRRVADGMAATVK